MPRPPRRLVAGGIYHVMNRGNRREPIFLSDGDRALFLDLVRQFASRLRWTLYGHCLLQNHYHLLLQIPEPSLSAGMQRINSEYAQWFNHVYGLSGHVFQGRYGAVLVESDWHFLELSRYLALNPVRAGLCDAPGDWRWGSYRALVGGELESLVASQKLLGYFGSDRRLAIDRLKRFVEDGLADPAVPSLDQAGSDPVMAE